MRLHNWTLSYISHVIRAVALLEEKWTGEGDEREWRCVMNSHTTLDRQHQQRGKLTSMMSYQSQIIPVFCISHWGASRGRFCNECSIKADDLMLWLWLLPPSAMEPFCRFGFTIRVNPWPEGHPYWLKRQELRVTRKNIANCEFLLHFHPHNLNPIEFH